MAVETQHSLQFSKKLSAVDAAVSCLQFRMRWNIMTSFAVGALTLAPMRLCDA